MKTLGEVAKDAYERDGATWEAVAEAVAAHVRAEDAARGGTLSEKEVAKNERIIREALEWITSQGKNASLPLLALKVLVGYAAAQGRTISMLKKWLADVTEALVGERPVGVMPSTTLEEARRLVRERSEARAELAKAEAALATLRDEVSAVVKKLPVALDWGYLEERKRLERALKATPAEHPDTATLRARFATAAVETLENPTGNAGCRYVDCCAAALAEAERRLLGDSGPSGGGERCEHSETSWDASGPCGLCGADPEGSGEPERGPEVREMESTDYRAPPATDLAETPTAPPAEPASPTTEEDWREVERFARSHARKNSPVLSALARLREEPRRAMESTPQRARMAKAGRLPPSGGSEP